MYLPHRTSALSNGCHRSMTKPPWLKTAMSPEASLLARHLSHIQHTKLARPEPKPAPFTPLTPTSISTPLAPHASQTTKTKLPLTPEPALPAPPHRPPGSLNQQPGIRAKSRTRRHRPGTTQRRLSPSSLPLPSAGRDKPTATTITTNALLPRCAGEDNTPEL